MYKLQTEKSFKYSLMDLFGPVRETLTQNDYGCEKIGLEQIVEKLQN